MMKRSKFVARAKQALNSKTLYVTGGFGAPASDLNKARYTNGANKSRWEEIGAASDDTFFFDCVCLVKGILWGWDGNKADRNGGAIYASNGVPDVGTDSMMAMCTDSNTDFTNIVPGAIVWMPGHVGIYIGDGLVIEATAKWEGKVLTSVCRNVVPDTKKKYARTWMRWEKLPWVDYTEESMTYEQWKAYMNRYLAELAQLPPSNEEVQARIDKVKKAGLMMGDPDGNFRPQSAIKREEVAIILSNLLPDA